MEDGECECCLRREEKKEYVDDTMEGRGTGEEERRRREQERERRRRDKEEREKNERRRKAAKEKEKLRNRREKMEEMKRYSGITSLHKTPLTYPDGNRVNRCGNLIIHDKGKEVQNWFIGGEMTPV